MSRSPLRNCISGFLLVGLLLAIANGQVQHSAIHSSTVRPVYHLAPNVTYESAWEDTMQPVANHGFLVLDEAAEDSCTACEDEEASESCTEDSCTASGGDKCSWCQLGDSWTLQSMFDEGEEAPFTIGGWAQGGYHSNANGLFNDHPDRFNAHQIWLYLERTADPEAGFLDWGLRLDTVYGVDAQDTQAFGNPPGSWDFQNGFDFGIYGWAIPQAYLEVASENVSVKFGHFFTLIGYEVVTAPDNFFYSHAYTMYNSEPFTHTGVVSTITASENVNVYAGWTLGWDTGFDQFSNGSSFLGGFSWQLSDATQFIYMTTFGDFGARGEGYSHSLIFDVQLSDQWNYVLQSDLVDVDASGTRDHDVGINQYLFYNVNDCLGFGGRIEWWHDDGTSFNQATVGINYRPFANGVLRPEVRHDWSPANNLDQTTFGIDAILTF